MNNPSSSSAQQVTLSLPLIDLSHLSHAEQAIQIEREATAEAGRGFDLREPPLLRVRMLRLAQHEHVLLLTMHHIITDAWSLEVLLREIAALYEAYERGEESALEELEVQYGDYAVWQRERLKGEELERELGYWREQLRGAPAVLELPTDRVRPAVQTYRGGRQSVRVTSEVVSRLREVGQSEGATLYMVLLGAFSVLLWRYSGAEDVVVGTPVANRTRGEVEGLIGFFVNTLVMRVEVRGEESYRELVRRVREVSVGGYGHQEVPFEKVVEELTPERSLSHTPLFQVMFNMPNVGPHEIKLSGLTIENLSAGEDWSKFDLTVYVREQRDEVGLTLVYNSDLFDHERMVEMLEQFNYLLSQAAAHPEQEVGSYSLVTPGAESLLPDPTQMLDDKWEGAVGELFSAQAQLRSEQIAVEDKNGAWTYKLLEAQSNKLAHYLRGNGIGSQNVVAIYSQRSASIVWAMLGVLKAGAAFVILDPSYPTSRQIDILNEAQPKGWLQLEAAGSLPGQLEEFVSSEFYLCRLVLPLHVSDQEHELLSDYPQDSPKVEIGPDDLAYIAFTSGSTVKPKGILGRHGSLTHFTSWWQETFKLGEQDRFSMLSGLAHDPLHRDILLPLLLGASICVPDPEQISSPGYIAEWLRREKVTVANLTPAMSQLLTEATPNDTGADNLFLRYAFFIGDQLVMRDVERLRKLSPRVTCVNLYGTTETQRAIGYYVVPESEAAPVDERQVSARSESVRIPLGRGIRDVQLLIIGASSQLAGIGEQGEICFRSPHLAIGYLNNEELTRQKFVINPFTKAAGDWIYKTGDLGRYLPDGNVMAIGRADQQVKIRGFRIELEEVEGTLAQHPSVSEVVVIAREVLSSEKSLVAYLVTAENERPGASELRGFLTGRLPDYMIPAAFMWLDKIPLTPNGKLDRAALPSPDQVSSAQPSLVEPRTSVEEILVEIWSDVLRAEQVSVNANFFELGGHSLLATQLIARVQDAFSVKLPLRTIFEAPTVAGFASVISELKGERDAYEAAISHLPLIEPDAQERYAPFPLTDIQQAYWIGRHSTMELGNVASHRYLEFESDNLDFERFNTAWQKLIERHDMLRAFIRADVQQQILRDVTPYEINLKDLRGLTSEEAESYLAAVRERMSHQMLAIDRWPLFEIQAFQLDAQRLRVNLSFDYLITDAWSFQILFRDLLQFYNEPETVLPPLTLSFRDYVVAEAALRNSGLYHLAQEYWHSRLPTLPAAPELPMTKTPDSLSQQQFVRRRAQLAPELWSRLKARAASAGLTSSGIVLAAFSEILAAWSKNPRFTIVLTLFKRLPLHTEVNNIVGDFTSTTLLAVEGLGATFRERARHLQAQLWDDFDHRYVSGVQVLRELIHAQGGRARAMMPVVFTSTLDQRLAGQDGAAAEMFGKVVYSITQTPQVILDHQVSEQAGALVFNWDAVEELFPEKLLDEMFEAYCQLLQRLAVDDESWRQRQREVLPHAQLERLESINDTGAFVSDELLHALFSRQVDARRHSPAVISSGQTLNYEQLARLSNRIGHRLRQLGAVPNSLVAVVIGKGWEQVAAVLGVSAAGAAYLPISPELPQERIRYLLQHGEVQCVLTTSCLKENLAWPSDLQVLCVDDDEEFDGVSDEPLKPVQTPDDLAYVIYTSGSTGLPKGVMISHRSAVNTILDINQRFNVSAGDRVLALSSLSFDLSVYDIFGTLATGGTIVIPDASVVRDAAHWVELIIREQITVWNSVPALAEMLVEYLSEHRDVSLESLRLVLMSGDWIPVSLPERLKSLSSELQVISLGGATEASIWSIIYSIEKIDPAWKSIPYGQPMRNQSFHVLDEMMDPRPVWVAGHLYIGGVGLAQGYWRDDAKTGASFVQHPRTGERLYRTGDIGRYLPDGNIEFLGREDLQVKVQGYRVELGEIEATLARHPAVRVSVVKLTGQASGNRHLIAYYVAGEPPPSGSELRSFLQDKLPHYMLPSTFIAVDEFPLTPNGKIDRAALPEPAPLGSAPPQGAAAGKPEITSRINSLVASVLKLDSVAPSANLLDLGANSVDIIRIANLLEKELGFRPRIDDFYQLPTVEGLVETYHQQLSQGHPPHEKAGLQINSYAGNLLAPGDVIHDPQEREEFKKRRPGLRSAGNEHPSVQLSALETDEELRTRYALRRSHRDFLPQPIPFENLSRFLGCLRQFTVNGNLRALYASAGGLYPVQAYLHVKPERVADLTAGTYYYQPVEHRLVRLSAQAEIDRTIHEPFVNRPVFDQAAFSIFLVAQMKTITPMYGQSALQYAVLEAGYMSQLLMTSASSTQLGLCPIGGLHFERISQLFALEEGHILLHSLLGGGIDTLQEILLSSTQEALYRPDKLNGPREEGEV